MSACTNCGAETDWDEPDPPLCLACYDAWCDGNKKLMNRRKQQGAALKMLRSGATRKEISRTLKIHLRTLYRWWPNKKLREEIK